MPRCSTCKTPIKDQAMVGMVEITEVPVARLARDGTISRSTSERYTLWCADCTKEVG